MAKALGRHRGEQIGFYPSENLENSKSEFGQRQYSTERGKRLKAVPPVECMLHRVRKNTVFAVSSVAQETATYEDATTQVPDDLPLDEIFKLIDQVSEPGPLLKDAGYKYVGEYSEGRSVIETWCRNCTCNKRGEVLSFQSGTSSVVCSFMGMGSPSTLLLEVFNTKARDAII